MKKICLLFWALFAGLLASSQDNAAYNLAMKNVQTALNSSKMDELCKLFEPNAAGNCVWTDKEIASIVSCFGKIESFILLSENTQVASGNKVYFLLKCARKQIVLSCVLNDQNHFSTFEFNDKSLAAQRMLRAGKK